MNGPHDLGGMMGFGPIDPEPDEPVFHAPWEKRMLAMRFATGAAGKWNIDVSRHARETIPPPQYLNMTYYQIWLTGLEKQIVASGLATAEELAAGGSLGPPAPIRGVLRAAGVPDAVTARGSYMRPAPGLAAFAVGDRVRTRNLHPTGHTRLPRYARGKAGTIERVNGCMVFPDSNAHGRGEDPKWCYAVGIAGTELWGADADPTLSVSLDLFEPYLEAG